MSAGPTSAYDRDRRPALAGAATLREILVPSDLSSDSDLALEQARVLARRFDARLTLYHVVEIPYRDYGSLAAAQGDALWSATRREAAQELSRRGVAAGVRCEVIVERALSAHRALVGYVRAQRPDLVVMASHGSDDASHLLLGSATERVLQHGRRPLLCVRAAAHGGTLPYRRLLVPTDLSPASRQAFPIAGLLARKFGAEIVVLNVAALSPLPNLSGGPLGHEAGVSSQDALLKFVAPELEGLPLTARIEGGVAWDRIVRCAGEVGADLIVMARRGLDSVADRILGSHTERIVRHAPCPVLVA